MVGLKLKRRNIMESKRNLFVYYLRDEKNAPIVTVTIKRNGDMFGRGLALCSFRETPSKALGRLKSYVRADKALRIKDSSDEIIRTEAQDVLINVKDAFGLICIWKSEYLTKEGLTDFEKRLFRFDERK
jgi:hypothetical protein